MFSNQTDPTGKFMNLAIAYCVIAQVRYIGSQSAHGIWSGSMFIVQNIYIGIISKQWGIL